MVESGEGGGGGGEVVRVGECGGWEGVVVGSC